MIALREMRESDIDAMVGLEQVCFHTPWTRADFEGESANPLALYLVACDGDTVVGYVGCWLIFDEGHITNVAVSPEHRRQGIGKALLTELIARGEAKGVTSFTLEVRPSNDKALALYRHFGFGEAGRRKHYYPDNGEDAIIMWRRPGE